jgi:hypothetical protein
MMHPKDEEIIKQIIYRDREVTDSAVVFEVIRRLDEEMEYKAHTKQEIEELFQDVGEIEQWMIHVKAEDRNYFENIWKELGEAKAKFPTVRHYMMEVIKKAREAGIR